MIIFIIPKEYNHNFSLAKINVLLKSNFKTNDACFKYVPIKYINTYKKVNSYHILSNEYNQALSDIISVLKHHFMTPLFYVDKDGHIREYTNFFKSDKLVEKYYPVFDDNNTLLCKVPCYNTNKYIRSIYLSNINSSMPNCIFFDTYEEARVLQNYYIQYMIHTINADIQQIKNTLLNQENKLLNFLNLLDKQ